MMKKNGLDQKKPRCRGDKILSDLVLYFDNDYYRDQL